jgi:hypothetical protein
MGGSWRQIQAAPDRLLPLIGQAKNTRRERPLNYGPDRTLLPEPTHRCVLTL